MIKKWQSCKYYLRGAIFYEKKEKWKEKNNNNNNYSNPIMVIRILFICYIQ